MAIDKLRWRKDIAEYARVSQDWKSPALVVAYSRLGQALDMIDDLERCAAIGSYDEPEEPNKTLVDERVAELGHKHIHLQAQLAKAVDDNRELLDELNQERRENAALASRLNAAINRASEAAAVFRTIQKWEES